MIRFFLLETGVYLAPIFVYPKCLTRIYEKIMFFPMPAIVCYL